MYWHRALITLRRCVRRVNTASSRLSRGQTGSERCSTQVEGSDVFSAEGHSEVTPGRAQLDPIEMPQNETLPELPHVGRLSPPSLLPIHLLNASELVLSDNNSTQLENICFKACSVFHRHLLQELDFRLLNRFFLTGPRAKKLAPRLIYCVKIAATWLLSWQRENCVWLKKKKSSPLRLTSHTSRWRSQRETVQSLGVQWGEGMWGK